MLAMDNSNGGSRSPDPHGYEKSSTPAAASSPRGTIPLPGVVSTPRGTDQGPAGQEWQTGNSHEDFLDAEREEGQTRDSSYGSIPGGDDSSTSGNGRYQQRSSARTSFSIAARKTREAQRLKTLQRTPYPLVLARIKLLLDRMHVLLSQPPIPLRGSTSSFGGGNRSAAPSRSQSMRGSSAASCRRSISSLTQAAQTAATATPAHKAAGVSVAGMTPGLVPVTPANRQEATRSVATPSEQDDGPGARNMTMDKVLEELSVTFYFVSEFMRRVADEYRLETCFVSTMESYKKEQVVFKNGDVADKFYIILMGSVDIWSSLPGSRIPRYHICTYKKGSSFGERAILNGDERQECAVPSSNCTFLTLLANDFLRIFRTTFVERYRVAMQFFREHVECLENVPETDLSAIIRYGARSIFPIGKEWEPQNESQIYFMFEGSAHLEAMDRKFVLQGVPRLSNLRGEDVASVGTTGDLANVQLLHGRPVGTLGHEAELRRLRRSMVPKKLIATLLLGSWFGGGPRLMGDGELQSCLKVTAIEQVTTYNIEISQFFRVASPSLIRAMRDDVTFKLTYYYGRLGAIGMDTVVGHTEAALHSNTSAPPPPGASTSNVDGAPGSPRGRSGPGMVGHPNSNRNKKGSRKASSPSIVAGAAGVETGRLGQAMQEAQAQADGGAATPVSLLIKGTPAERFWASPIFSGSAHSSALLPLLACIYPEGLAPLAAKVGELVDRHIEKTEGSALLPLSRPITSININTTNRGSLDLGSLATCHGQHSYSPQGSPRSPQHPQQQRRLPGMQNSSAPGTPSHDAMKRQIYGTGGSVGGGWGTASEDRGWDEGSGGGGFSGGGEGVGFSLDGRGASSGGGFGSGRAGPDVRSNSGFAELFAPQLVSRDVRSSHAGCLAAASIMWQRLSDNSRQPGLRQCLTYDEIQSIKAEEARLLAVPAAREGAMSLGGGGGGQGERVTLSGMEGGGGGEHRPGSVGGGGAMKGQSGVAVGGRSAYGAR